MGKPKFSGFEDFVVKSDLNAKHVGLKMWRSGGEVQLLARTIAKSRGMLGLTTISADSGSGYLKNLLPQIA